ncbi:unnamed protein product, partial [marine sediment metagenome]
SFYIILNLSPIVNPPPQEFFLGKSKLDLDFKGSEARFK